MDKEKQQKALRQARDRLVKESLPFNHVFGSPEGAKVLAKLKEEFDPVALAPDGSNHEGIVMRACQRDVIRYIETMMNLREVEDEKA